MKLLKQLKGCRTGDIYPTTFSSGEECPVELEEAAISLGVVDVAKKKNPTRKKSAE
jgi:hypothetical protein